MVVNVKIKCEICDAVFYVKYQIDRMLELYPWNFDIICPECGNRIHMLFDKNGSNSNCANSEDADRAYMVGYSSCLPITKNQYLSETGPQERMAFFSPFMNLYSLYRNKDGKLLQAHSIFINCILNNVLMYKHTLLELLPLLNKKDMKPEAYTKKVAKLFHIKSKNTLTKYTECVAHYSEMVKCCYCNIVPRTISKAPYGTLFMDLSNYITELSKSDLVDLRDKLNICGLKEWLTKNAFKHIADMMFKIEKYFPAMFYGVTAEYSCPHIPQLYILTINYEEVNTDYYKGYEVLEKILPLIVGLENVLNRGDVNNFGVDTKYSLDNFKNQTAGIKIGLIQKNDVLRKYFDGSLSNKIRNSEIHSDSDYDAINQICRYVNANNAKDILELALVDVAFMTYIQLVHIMEISLVVNTILQKIWK